MEHVRIFSWRGVASEDILKFPRSPTPYYPQVATQPEGPETALHLYWLTGTPFDRWAPHCQLLNSLPITPAVPFP